MLKISNYDSLIILYYSFKIKSVDEIRKCLQSVEDEQSLRCILKIISDKETCPPGGVLQILHSIFNIKNFSVGTTGHLLAMSLDYKTYKGINK